MRLSKIPKDRCRHALHYGTNLHTRCMFKAGHAGPGGWHEGKGYKRDPFRRIRWFDGDARQFFTDRGAEWTWSEKLG